MMPHRCKGLAMAGSCCQAASHCFCLSWGFHIGSSGEPGWGPTVLHRLCPPSPLLPLVILVHSTWHFCPGISTARLSRPFPPAPRDLPAVLASMGQLLPLALAMLIHGGRDAEAPALPCCLRAEPLLAGSARRGASCYSWRVFNGDGQSDTHRSCCQTCERGPGFVLMAGWVPQARGRWERGPGPVLTVQGRMLQPENSNQAPSPASLLEHPHGTRSALLSPLVIAGTKQQFQKNGGEKKGSQGESKGWQDPGKTESSRAGG